MLERESLARTPVERSRSVVDEGNGERGVGLMIEQAVAVHPSEHAETEAEVCRAPPPFFATLLLHELASPRKGTRSDGLLLAIAL